MAAYVTFGWDRENVSIESSSSCSWSCHCASLSWKSAFLSGRSLENASASSVAMPLRASLENHRCGLSPSEAPTVSAADTLTVPWPRFFVAQASYPAPLLTTTCACCSAAISEDCGSKSWASTAVVFTIEVTETSSPPICAANDPH